MKKGSRGFITQKSPDTTMRVKIQVLQLKKGIKMKIRKARPEEIGQIADLQRELMLHEKKIDPTYFDISKHARKRFVEFAKKKIETRQ